MMPSWQQFILVGIVFDGKQSVNAGAMRLKDVNSFDALIAFVQNERLDSVSDHDSSDSSDSTLETQNKLFLETVYFTSTLTGTDGHPWGGYGTHSLFRES
jgi:hypothetical protein